MAPLNHMLYLLCCTHFLWWRHQMETFSALLIHCAGNSPVNDEFPPTKPSDMEMFSLICAWTNGWVNNRDAGDLRQYRAHHVVIVMSYYISKCYNATRVFQSDSSLAKSLPNKVDRQFYFWNPVWVIVYIILTRYISISRCDITPLYMSKEKGNRVIVGQNRNPQIAHEGELTLWGRDKIGDDIFKCISFMKMYKCCLRFHWNMSPKFKLTTFQHWFR